MVTENELKEKIVQVIGESKRPLNKDEIMAILALREDIAFSEALVKMVFAGKLVTTLVPGATDNVLDSDNYQFGLKKEPHDDHP